jgi:hypothetical protein
VLGLDESHGSFVNRSKARTLFAVTFAREAQGGSACQGTRSSANHVDPPDEVLVELVLVFGRYPVFMRPSTAAQGGPSEHASERIAIYGARVVAHREGDQTWPALTAFLRRLGPEARRDLRRVLSSGSHVRADVIGQFHERDRCEMTEFLILLEEQEVGRFAVIQEIDRLDR